MDNNKLDFYLKNNLNVLVAGKHGVGKTSQVIDCFARNKVNYLYFSGSTMDAWVDLVGLPKEKTENGVSFTTLVPPESMAKGQVEAIFIDEFNRAPKKVRNALMELIQFKSINGRKYPNLRVVWAAVNPDDVNLDGFKYDVEPIDPAQLDRFQIQTTVPFEVDVDYFVGRYGTIVGNIACNWWNQLEMKQKNVVSPRRLDEALKFWNIGGDIADVLFDVTLPVSKLMMELEEGATERKLAKLFEAQDEEGTKKFFSNINNVTNSEPYLLKNADWTMFFSPYIPAENTVAFGLKLAEEIKAGNIRPDFRMLRNFIAKNHHKFTGEVAEIQKGFIEAVDKKFPSKTASSDAPQKKSKSKQQSTP
jgi:MoxR-like ATPase